MRGSLASVRVSFERLASKAWFTSKLSVLLPAQAQDDPAGDRLAASLQLQRVFYQLSGVPVAALGDQAFVDAVRDLDICCLSQGHGLDAGNVLAVLPHGELVLAVDGPTFQHLGVEEPAAGAHGLLRKLIPDGRRHLRIGMGVSQTRRLRAATPEEATSRWRDLAPPQECCSLIAYCGRERAEAYTFAPICGPRTVVRRVEMPVNLKRVQLGGSSAHCARPPFEGFASVPAPCSEEEFGEVCQDLLDWLGAVHLGIDAPFDDGGICGERGAGRAGASEEAWLWTMGEAMTGPRQVLHTLAAAVRALDAGAGWFLLSMWGCEDAPLSHHGGAHGFDLNGAHHVHLLAVRGAGAAGEARGLLLEATNALHTLAP